MEPTLVNTVSYFSVSLLVLSLADEEVIKESFLQENMPQQNVKNIA